MTDKEMGLESAEPNALGSPASKMSNVQQSPVMSPQEVKRYQSSAAKKLFRQMDKNSDGQLTHREIKKYLQANEAAKRLLTRPGEKWSELWKKMDSDPRNHLIDEAEFVNYYLSKCDE